MPGMKRDGGEVRRMGPVEDRHADLEGGHTVNVVAFDAAIDATPLLAGLPDGRCQCPHWGYVLKGRQTYRFADREEVYEEGDAFYVGPGHIPLVEPGTVIVQFSPTEPLRQTEAVLLEGARRLQGS